jgi:hypothetical protein
LTYDTIIDKQSAADRVRARKRSLFGIDFLGVNSSREFSFDSRIARLAFSAFSVLRSVMHFLFPFFARFHSASVFTDFFSSLLPQKTKEFFFVLFASDIK